MFSVPRNGSGPVDPAPTSGAGQDDLTPPGTKGRVAAPSEGSGDGQRGPGGRANLLAARIFFLWFASGLEKRGVLARKSRLAVPNEAANGSVSRCSEAEGMGIFQEFKKFAVKGNAVDLAVGIIIGGAFSTIVKSLVNDIIMPPIGFVTGGVDFSDLYLNLRATSTATSLEQAREAGEPVIAYGLFINNVISFLIVAVAVFILVKGMNSLQEKAEKAPEPEKPVEPPREVQLLEEIRDALTAPKS
jgi:large conductance mechanosensitive channel